MKKNFFLLIALCAISNLWAIGVRKDTYSYPDRIATNSRLTLENKWIYSTQKGNYEDNTPGRSAYVLGMAIKDGIMYFINKETKSLVRVDGTSGEMLDPIEITGEHIFEIMTIQNGEKVWSANRYGYSDIKFDQAGNCIIGSRRSSGTTFQAYVVDLETGEATLIIQEDFKETYTDPTIDAIGVAGHVLEDGVIMAADDQQIIRWLITNGEVTLDEIRYIGSFYDWKGVGSSAQIFPLDKTGSLFYVDGSDNLPALFYAGDDDYDCSVVDDFKYCKFGTKIGNNKGDTCSMETTQNGICEFSVGDETFIVLAATDRTGTPSYTFALYRYRPELGGWEAGFSSLEPLWYFPANGMGKSSTTFPTTSVSVEVEGNVAHIYLYVGNNGYAHYELKMESYELKLNTADKTMGKTEGSGIYAANTPVTFSAQANYGYHFTQWSDGNTTNPRTLVLTQDTTLTAEFAPNNYTISTKCNDTERGTTSGDVTTTYLDNVTISATANYGYHFTQWNDRNTDNPRQVQVTEDKIYTAYFDKNTYYITKNYDSNQGYVNGSSSGKYLDNITLTAEPNNGYHFVRWADGNTDNPRHFSLTQDTVFSAEFAQKFSGRCGDNMYWSYQNNTLTISGFGDMYNERPWELLINDIKTITISNGVTSIGKDAFKACSILTALTIPNSVTSIGDRAFLNCESLTSVTAPATFFDISESNWVSYTKSFTHVEVNAGELTANAFDFINRSYKTIKVLNLAATTNTTIADEAFKGCYNLNSLYLPSQLEYIPYMAVAECVKLKAITIPATVTEIEDRAFENCRTLNSVIFEGANAPQGAAHYSPAAGSALWRIGSWAFYNCHQLEHLTIPEGVTEVGDAAFYGCTYLVDMTLPSTVQSIGDNGFALCAKLQKIHLKATTPPTIQAKTFFDVNRQIPVYVPDEAVEAYESDPYWSEFDIQGVRNVATAVEHIQTRNSNNQKLLRDGQLIILRDGKIYNVMGIEL